MQIFELHFNPKEEKFFDSFVYEPESSYEKKLGSLYIAGELKNSLPSNSKLLDSLAQTIKKNYYTLSIKTAEKALSFASKKANEFLSEQVKKENVDWLGNLNFAVLSLNNNTITFTKTGDIKILLLRQSQIIDAGANLDMEEIDPYPLKIFFNIVSGKLIENDKIMIATKEVFNFLNQKNIIKKIASMENLDHKNIKQVLPPSLFSKGEGTNFSGICLINVLSAETQKSTGPIFFQNKAKFSLSKYISPIFKKISVLKIPKFKIPKIPLKKLKIEPRKKKMKIPIKKAVPLVERFKKKKNMKKIGLVVLLIVIIFLGFYLFQARPDREEKEIRAVLEQAQEKLDQAENLLIFGNEEEANNMLKQAWIDLSSLPEDKEEIISLKQKIEETLKEINKLEYIENPEIALELSPEQSLDHKEELYSLSGTNIFFSSSVYIYNEEGWRSKSIDPPFSNYSFSSYFFNLYFLNKDSCQVMKYSYKGGLEWGSPATWLDDPGTECEARSIAVDGSVWILNGNKSVLRYYNGELKEEIALNFFPFPEDMIMRTKPDTSYIYLMEQKNQRIIIIDKTGKIVKQFQSNKFDNLIDFDISNDEETIYILNSSTIYKLKRP